VRVQTASEGRVPAGQQRQHRLLAVQGARWGEGRPSPQWVGLVGHFGFDATVCFLEHHKMSITQTEDSIILDGGDEKQRLRAFNTQHNPRPDWNWDTHPNDNKHIVVRRVTINWVWDMQSVLWLCTERGYLSVTFEDTCSWVGGTKGKAMLLYCLADRTRSVVGVPD